jgi:heme-degrading monooxygenase HmoA
MLCALTVRKLKPGTLEDFMRAFVPDDAADMPAGWKRFYAIRNVDDENEVVTFGFFDGTVEELREGQTSSDYAELRGAADQFVQSLDADGVYEVMVVRSMEQARGD